MDASMEIEEYTSPDDWSSEVELSQLCRICASANEYLIPIFHGEGLEHELENKISQHLPIKVSEEDKLPIHLCYQCASTLIAWNDLVVTCIESEEKFKTVANSPSSTNYVQFTKDDIRQEEEVETQLVNSKQLADVDPEGTIIFQNEPNCENNPDETPNIVIEEVTSMDSQTLEDEVSSNSRCNDLQESCNSNKNIQTNNCSNPMVVEDDTLLSRDKALTTLCSLNKRKASSAFSTEFAKHSFGQSKINKRFHQEKQIATKVLENLAANRSGFKLQPSVGSSVPLYICSTCGEGNLLFKKLEQHSELHPQFSKSNFCNLCRQQFEEKTELEVHLEIHLDNNDLVCQFCNKKFSIIEDLEQHEDTHLHEEFKCVQCREMFNSKDLVISHFKVSHSTGCYCGICQTNIKPETSLEEHFMTHTAVSAITRIVKNFICETCGVKYDSNVSLQRHTLFVHNDRMPYICDICGFTAYHEEPLREHLAHKHQTIEYPSQIKTTKTFRSEKSSFRNISSNNLGIKLGINLDEIPKYFTCKFCSVTFDSEPCYKYHVALKHHLEALDFEKNFSENKVDKKSTPIPNRFPFKCAFCKSSFKLEFELEDHQIKKHNKNVRYQCHFCFIDFKKDETLQKHLRKVHNGEYSSDDSDLSE